MRTRDFYDREHAVAYLRDSLIRYDGDPAYVLGVGYEDKKGYDFTFLNVLTGKQYKAFTKDDKTDMSPVPLGMLYTDETSAFKFSGYYERAPVRAWKQGLTSNTLFGRPVIYGKSQPSGSEIIASTYLAKTIKGLYPDYGKAFELSIKGACIPFSRRFAIFDNKLYYKHFIVPVGTANKSGPVLTEEFDFLRQVLQKDTK